MATSPPIERHSLFAVTLNKAEGEEEEEARAQSNADYKARAQTGRQN